ncbi:MAG: sigma-70 family RNA polymerase sigma factor [Bacteroidota bacterium]
MIDYKLLKACAKNDRKSQFLLYKESYSLLMSIAFRYKSNKEDAEDLVNQGFHKILKNVGSFVSKEHPIGKFMPWMSRVMINSTIDAYRKNVKRSNLMSNTQEIQEHMHAANYNEIEEQIEAHHLQNMLENLSEIQRKIFNLFAIDGYGHDEIAQMLGVPVGTSKWHLSSARKSLQSMLNEFIKENEKITQS